MKQNLPLGFAPLFSKTTNVSYGPELVLLKALIPSKNGKKSKPKAVRFLLLAEKDHE